MDQSQQKHTICVMNEAGSHLAQFEIPPTGGGFERLPQACLVALESGHSRLVAYLLDQGYGVYVIPGKAVDRYRDRLRQSRSTSDKRDALVLAEVLRTDRHLSTPWQADQPLTRQIASQVQLVQDLQRSILRFTNRGRCLLERYYPLATGLFSGLDQQIALHFIPTYPTPQQARQLSQEQFTAFGHSHHYYRALLIARRYGQLLQAELFARAEVASAYATQAQALAGVSGTLIRERDQAQKDLTYAFGQHPDAPVFASLPGAGPFLAPALLSKFHDCRARFPTAAVAQAIAGTSPVTIQSGKKRRVQFRSACDRVPGLRGPICPLLDSRITVGRGLLPGGSLPLRQSVSGVPLSGQSLASHHLAAMDRPQRV